MHTRTWHVDIYLAETDDLTTARAVLTADTPNCVEAIGTAHRNPRDRRVPEIGDELAASRALAELADELLDLATRDIEGVAGKPVRLVR